MKQKRILKVTWRDSCNLRAGWKSGNEVEGMKPSLIESIGFVLTETKLSITLVPHLVDDGDCTGEMCIPKGCIVRKRILR